MTSTSNMTAGLIAYSSKTGNTRRVAQAVFTAMGNRAYIASVDDKPDAGRYPWVIVGFWVDRGTLDTKALEFIRQLDGCKVGLIGTLGAYPDSDHARDVEKRAREIVSEKNEVLGCFLCQGKIDPELTRQFENLPPDHPHAMDDARRERHLEAAKHPNEEDFRAAVAACETMIGAAVAI